MLMSLEKTSNFDVNRNIDRLTALMPACTNREAGVVKLLLSIPHINIHLKDKEGNTAFDLMKRKDTCTVPCEVKRVAENQVEIKASFQGELLSLEL
jgi:hypothetical protein